MGYVSSTIQDDKLLASGINVYAGEGNGYPGLITQEALLIFRIMSEMSGHRWRSCVTIAGLCVLWNAAKLPRKEWHWENSGRFDV